MEACDMVRVHAAAGLALVRSKDGATRWVPHDETSSLSPSSSLHQGNPADEPVDDDNEGIIHLQQVDNDDGADAAPSLALQRDHFGDARVAFEIVRSADGLTPQNIVVFLHGRGDSHGPFARLGKQMALPQTAVISLRAPLELPFEMGHTWIDDLDDDFNVIPPTVAHPKRSGSLQATRDFVRSFLETLRDRYHWRLDRVFLFGFSQGASVAYDVACTLPYRLGGVVLVAGGAVNGPHITSVKHDHETPALLLCGGRDDVFPLSLAEQSERTYKTVFKNKTVLTRHVVTGKTHDMIRSRDEMRVVMEFFSKHLYLRDIALESRSDVIEITAGKQHHKR